MKDCKYLKKLTQSENNGVWLVVAVITGVLALAALIALLVKLTKSRCTCDDCCCDECDNDDAKDGHDECCDECQCGHHHEAKAHSDEENCDENGCCYTNDKDFV